MSERSQWTADEWVEFLEEGTREIDPNDRRLALRFAARLRRQESRAHQILREYRAGGLRPGELLALGGVAREGR